MTSAKRIRLAVPIVGIAILVGAGCSRSVESQPSTARRPAAASGSVTTVFEQQYSALANAANSRLASTAARGKFATFLHANDRLTEAISLYETLRREDPQEPRWPYYLARILQERGENDRSLALLDEAAARAPGRSFILLRRADLLFKSGATEQAEAEYQRYLLQVPGDPHAQLGLARVAIQKGEWHMAESLLRTTSTDAKDLASVRHLLVTVYEALGETRKANQAREGPELSARFRSPDDPWGDELEDACVDAEKLSVLADIALESGRANRAMHLLRRALELEPKRGRTHYELARVHLESSERETALSLLKEAVQRDPKLAEAHYLLVSELQSAGKAALALAAADEATRLNPRRSGLHRQRGVLLQQAGRTEDAEASFLAAVALDPSDVNNFEALGNFQWASSRRAEAVIHFEKARSLSKLAVKARAMLGSHYLGDGRLDEAARCIQEAFEVDPRLEGLASLRALLHVQRGNAAFRAHDFARAEHDYRQALEADAVHEEALTNVVAVLQRTGRVDAAKLLLDEFAREHPAALFTYQLGARAAAQSGDRVAALKWIERGLLVARQQHDAKQETALHELAERIRRR